MSAIGRLNGAKGAALPAAPPETAAFGAHLQEWSGEKWADGGVAVRPGSLA